MTTKTDPYEFGNSGPTELLQQADKRGEYRLSGRVRVQVELESAEPGGEQQPRMVAAVSTDVSPGGLRLSLGEALPVGALLPVVVSLDGKAEEAGRREGQGERGAFSLMVEVIWTRQAGQGLCQSGTRVLESTDGDYLAWMKALARAMEMD